MNEIIIPDANGGKLDISTTEDGFVQVGEQKFDTEQIGWMLSALEAAADVAKTETEERRLGIERAYNSEFKLVVGQHVRDGDDNEGQIIRIWNTEDEIQMATVKYRTGPQRHANWNTDQLTRI